MKKYVKPTMNGEMFVANEYVGACWIVKCDVPGGYATATLYDESNGISGLQTTGTNKDKVLLSEYGIHGCNKDHIGVISSETEQLPFNGYWVYGRTTFNVYWWDQDLGSDYDYHATTTPDQATTNPNAS